MDRVEWLSVLMIPISGVAINIFISWLFEHMRAEVTISVEPNQGIKNSWRNIIFFSIIAFLFIIILSLRFHFIDSLIFKSFSYSVVFSYIICIVGFAAFEGGGKAFLQHCFLRIVLAANRYAPFRYDLLLNYCTERLLLQRIGGRYRFMHKTLQDYFAKMELE
jgi:hypothetical protein